MASRAWAFGLLAALTIAFGALALTLPGSGSSGTGDAAPSPTLKFQGAFSWEITTVPSRVHHGRPMRFSVSVAAPYGALPEYDMSLVEYGDGSGAGETVDFSSAGIQPCQITYSPKSTPPASSPGGSRSSAPPSPMSWPEHTYAKAGRYTVVITYANNCLPAQEESVTYRFVVN